MAVRHYLSVLEPRRRSHYQRCWWEPLISALSFIGPLWAPAPGRQRKSLQILGSPSPAVHEAVHYCLHNDECLAGA